MKINLTYTHGTKDFDCNSIYAYNKAKNIAKFDGFIEVYFDNFHLVMPAQNNQEARSIFDYFGFDFDKYMAQLQ